MKLKLESELNKLGNIISKIIPIPYTNTSLTDNLKSYNIKILYFNNEPYKAFLFWNHQHDQPVIALNAFLNHAQAIFAMAHELGHLLINYHWSPLDGICRAKIRPTEYCGGSYQPKQLKNESIVNRVAESYLMPDRLIKSLIKKNHQNNVPKYVTINQIMYKFKVQRTRAEQRFNDYTQFLKEKAKVNE